MSDQFKFGSWIFNPAAGQLSSVAGDVSLEYRSAQALTLLLDNAGELVTQDDFVKTIWNGRSVSANSVAVVIGDLRRALGDDARKPQFIETVPKRGYRWIGDVSKSAERAQEPVSGDVRRKSFGSLAGLGLILFAAIAAFLLLRPSSAPDIGVALSVGEFVNETQNPEHDPLSPAVRELVSTELSKYDSLTVSANGDVPIRVSGKLFMWNDRVSASLHAEDVATGERIWSGMASGPKEKLPGQIQAELKEFAETLVGPEY